MLRLIVFLVLFPVALFAQGATKTILVLDGSGSMWGQIDGVNKIVIARKVIEGLLTTLPPEQELGLMSYGHRRKGDCADIELLIEPGTDRAAILAAVNAINPRGMTPLSDAVIAAAEALRYTEEVATVILVSDGIETCDRDPCAVGRELEAAGIGFTAHVVGFDVAGEPEALAQLQCLADETGGMFRTAANAEELAQALDVVVSAPEPEPEPAPLPARVTFQALDGEGGGVIRDGLVWFVETDAAGVALDHDASAPEPMLSLLPGEGRAEVLRLADEAVAEARFTVAAGPLTVTLVLPEFRPPASVSPPAEAPAGSTIAVEWTGPDAADDYISVAEAGTPEGTRSTKVFTARGTPATLRLPMEPGDYEIRYVLREGPTVLAAQPITLTEVTATLDAPASLPAGSEVVVRWEGPDYDRDYIAIARPDAPDTGFEVRTYTGNANPARLKAPTTPGDYELRYVGNDNGTKVLARQPLVLTEVHAELEAPAQAPAGSTLSVGWSGNGAERDRIEVARPGTTKAAASQQLRGLARVEVTLPPEPGAWELRYVQQGSPDVVLTTRPLELTPVTAQLDAPDTATAGSRIEVAFEGPGNPRDFIVFARPGDPTHKREETAYPRNGSPVSLSVPRTPGAWELRYLLGGAHGTVIATRPITVE